MLTQLWIEETDREAIEDMRRIAKENGLYDKEDVVD